MDAAGPSVEAGLPTKLSTADGDDRVSHNPATHFSEKLLDFDHTSGRLADLAPVALLGAGTGAGD